MQKNASPKIAFFDTAKASAAGFFQGGFNSDTITRDPLLSGFAFIKWLKLPKWVDQNLKSLTEKNLRNFGGLNDIDMNTVAIQEGFTGSENMFAGGIQRSQGFTMSHREYSGSPVRNAYRHWVTGIRDPETGISRYPREYNLEYSAENHTGELLYVQTRPDADNVNNPRIIEQAVLFTMVMPLRIHYGHHNFSAGTSDGTELEQQFAGVPHISEAVDEIAIEQIKNIYSFQTMGDYKRP